MGGGIAAPLDADAPDAAVHLTFADELRQERLLSLCNATLILAALGVWLAIAFSIVQERQGTFLSQMLPFAVIALAAFISRGQVKRGRTRGALWILALGIIGGVALRIAGAPPGGTEIIIFALPLTIFVVGLIGRPRDTVYAALICAAVVIVLPALAFSSWVFFDGVEVVAVVLILVSAAISISFTGDLYQITDWALYNYSRERRAANDLYESRQTLERTLLRAQVLAEDLQQLNIELETARRAAEEAKRYRGQFLANMSHELRTPLNAILGFSETMLHFPMMYDEVTLPEAYSQDMSQIFSSGQQLLILINDILDLSKVDAGKLEVQMERVELPPLIEHVVSTAAGLIGLKPVSLSMDIAPDLPAIRGDRARTAQVLLNLYSNAAKFTSQGHIHITATAEGDSVHLAVRDTGKGIAADSLETIFEEFRQADTEHRDPRQGSGLGLAISRQLMTLMGGDIWAESSVGMGSTFHLRFAVDSAPAQTQAAPALPMPAGA